MRLITVGITSLFLLCIQFSSAQQTLNQVRFHLPESIISDGKHYYISDIGPGLDPKLKDTNGLIRKMNLDGSFGADSIFAEGLHAPKGSTIINNILLVADIDKLIAFSLETGKKKYEIDLAGFTGFANDVVLKDKNTVLVSAMDKGKILTIDLAHGNKVTELPVAGNIAGTNGLYYDARQQRIYLCTFDFADTTGKSGQVGFIDLKQPSPYPFTRLIDRGGFYDGISLGSHQQLFVSDWGADFTTGQLLQIDLRTKTVRTINEKPISGPADFFVNNKNELLLPAMIEGKILKFNAAVK